MTILPLATYLRLYRKRTGFSRDEIAFLLGSMSGTIVSRHELGRRIPVLRTAIMYALILETEVESLYEGAFVQMQEVVRTRAKALHTSLERKPPSLLKDRKMAALKRILATTGELEEKVA